jgi:hypothetical protein
MHHDNYTRQDQKAACPNKPLANYKVKIAAIKAET